MYEHQTDWGKGVKIVMIRRNISTRELSERSGVPLYKVSSVTSGAMRNDKACNDISNYLGYSISDLELIGRGEKAAS